MEIIIGIICILLICALCVLFTLFLRVKKEEMNKLEQLKKLKQKNEELENKIKKSEFDLKTQKLLLKSFCDGAASDDEIMVALENYKDEFIREMELVNPKTGTRCQTYREYEIMREDRRIRLIHFKEEEKERKEREALEEFETNQRTFNCCTEAISAATDTICSAVINAADHTVQFHHEICDFVIPFFVLGAISSQYIHASGYIMHHSDVDSLEDELANWVFKTIHKKVAALEMEDRYESILMNGNFCRDFTAVLLKNHTDDRYQAICLKLLDSLGISTIYLTKTDIQNITDAIKEAFGHILFSKIIECCDRIYIN